MATPSVFISIGAPTTEAQRAFKVAIKNCISAQGFEPRIVGDNPEDTDPTHERPFDHAIDLIRICDGAIIVAYEKDRATALVRNRMGEPAQMVGEDVRLTTVWNHAEAAIIYSLRLPMILLAERGVRKEGMLEQGVLGNVVDIELSQEYLTSETFKRRMDSWARIVKQRAAKPRTLSPDALESISLSDLWSLIVRLRLSTIAAVLSVLITLIGVAYWVGSRIGALGK